MSAQHVGLVLNIVGENEQIASTSQGNKFTHDVCRDVLAFIAKELEDKELGVKHVDI